MKSNAGVAATGNCHKPIAPSKMVSRMCCLKSYIILKNVSNLKVSNHFFVYARCECFRYLMRVISEYLVKTEQGPI